MVTERHTSGDRTAEGMEAAYQGARIDDEPTDPKGIKPRTKGWSPISDVLGGGAVIRPRWHQDLIESLYRDSGDPS